MQDKTGQGKIIRRKVLVVDDEEISRRIMGRILGRDYDVMYAENGAEALAAVKENCKTLSLILLDLMMPVMGGYEVMAALNADEALRRIPVIVLTSEKSAEVKSLEMGAADFIPKPYDSPEVVLARVSRSIELAEDNIIINAAEIDSLTGLYTKEFFFQYCRRHDRYSPDMSMDAMVFNVNRFHFVNELYGRSYGDKVLRTIADRIIEALEGTDGIACRCEPDTFYVYTAHIGDYKTILGKMQSCLAKNERSAYISIRLGIYADADKSIEVEQRFDRATRACNRLRSVYTTSFALYDTGLMEKELYLERLINDMDAALAEKQFRVFYQPKYDIRGDRPSLASAEALVRWFHPEFGMISPGVFIPLFEENGLIQKLDRYVWNEAAAQIREWKDKFGVTIPVSVNVSRIDIFDPNIENELTEIVRSNGLVPEEYLLEITESAYTGNSDRIIETVDKLRSIGFRVEMDDFGTGYSSLNMLTSLPIDALKLDMVFIRNICESEKDYHMVKLMIDIARFLSVPVIAEGVEDEKQCELLKKAGCDMIQGFLFSKPVPPEEFERFIKEDKNADSR